MLMYAVILRLDSFDWLQRHKGQTKTVPLQYEGTIKLHNETINLHVKYSHGN